jgi:predicted phosphodiesterase
MRIALISDIHGNTVALETVLDDLAGRAVDRIVCLGDVAAGGPRPREAIARIAALGCPVVVGNTDEMMLDRIPIPAVAPPVVQLLQWCKRQLGDADRAPLAGYSPTVTVPLDAAGEVSLLCYHGTPGSHSQSILPTTSDEDLETRLGSTTALVSAGGHTHMQMLRPFRGRMVVNPGTIGGLRTGMAGGGPLRAEYAVVEWVNSTLSVELRRLACDPAAFRRMARDAGMPDPNEWLAKLGDSPAR